mgnify:CR=1 FL=1
MRVPKLVFYVVLCIMVVTGNPTPTLAEKQEPDNPKKGEILTRKLTESSIAERMEIWQGLPQEDKAAVVEYNTVVRIEAEDVLEPPASVGINTWETTATSGCDVRGKKEKGYNIFGQVLWEYYSRVEWCYNGTNVTSKFATHTGKAGPFPSLWEYMGDAVSPVESGGVGKTYYRIWVNGYFRLAIAGYPIQTAYPWIDITVRGNGTSTASSGQ